MEEDCSFIFYESDYLQTSFSAFQDMRMKGEHVDVTVKARDRLFPAHRVVLAARVPKFRQILATQEKEISLNEINSDVLESIINFAYEGKLKVEAENLHSMLFAAVCLGLSQVQKACFDFQGKRFNSKEEVSTLKFIPSDIRIRNNFDEFCISEEFLLLPYCSLKELISRDDIKVTNEEKVFEAVMKWIEMSPVERRHRLPYLLPEIRLNYVSPKFLIEKVMDDVFIRASEQCTQIVEEAKNWHLLKKRPVSLSFRVNPRMYIGKNKNIKPGERNSDRTKNHDRSRNITSGANVSPYGIAMNHSASSCSHSKNHNVSSCSLSESHNVSLYDHPEVHTVSSCSHSENHDVTLNSRTHSYNVSSHNPPDSHSVSKNLRNGIYIVRSFCSAGTFVSYYNSLNRKWNNFLPCSSSESALQAVYVGENLYVFFLKSIEVFHLVSHQWYTVGDLSTTTESSGIVSSDHKIFIFGGTQLPEIVRSFDTQRNQWLQDEVMNIPCHSMSVASSETDIFLTGGYSTSCSNNFVKFRPITKQWNIMPSMVYNRMDHSSAVLNDHLYVCGGRNNYMELLETVEAYDQASGQWSFISFLKIPRYSHSMVTWNGKLYVFGGETKQDICSSDVEVYDVEFDEWMFGVPVPSYDNRTSNPITVCLSSEEMLLVNLRAVTVISMG